MVYIVRAMRTAPGMERTGGGPRPVTTDPAPRLYRRGRKFPLHNFPLRNFRLRNFPHPGHLRPLHRYPRDVTHYDVIFLVLLPL